MLFTAITNIYKHVRVCTCVFMLFRMRETCCFKRCCLSIVLVWSTGVQSVWRWHHESKSQLLLCCLLSSSLPPPPFLSLFVSESWQAARGGQIAFSLQEEKPTVLQSHRYLTPTKSQSLLWKNRCAYCNQAAVISKRTSWEENPTVNAIKVAKIYTAVTALVFVLLLGLSLAS